MGEGLSFPIIKGDGDDLIDHTDKTEKGKHQLKRKPGISAGQPVYGNTVQMTIVTNKTAVLIGPALKMNVFIGFGFSCRLDDVYLLYGRIGEIPSIGTSGR